MLAPTSIALYVFDRVDSARSRSSSRVSSSIFR
jgi:hypothetical protein